MTKDILSYDAKLFLDVLQDRFEPQIKKLLLNRKNRKGKIPARIMDAESEDPQWKVLPPPKDILDRRVEITGPPVRKMIINALNSGANVFMADFEDSNSPTWENCIDGQQNLYDAVRKKIDFVDPKTQKEYKLNKKVATLFVRPRGLHLVEKNYNNIPASLFDFGLYFFHNHKQLLKNGTRPYFYLPKIEHYREARLWNEIFSFAESSFDLPVGTIRATVLIETLPAAFQMDKILYELRGHSVGLNCGRWDYIFSFIKSLSLSRGAVLPDRDQVGMTEHFMRSYTQLLIQTCHKRGAHAIGGMAAQIPIKDDPEANHVAMNKVRADKLREVQDGHDGTWVAHPVLVDVAKEIFDEHLKTPNQIDKQLYLNYSIESDDLLCTPKGQCTEAALRKNIGIAFQYINSWINGNGCVPIDNLMEDAATAEISRAQIWQWRKHKIYLSNGKQVTNKYLGLVINSEIKKFEHYKKFEETSIILNKLCFSEEIIDFLTLECYDNLCG
jgi:malate synthase